MDESKLGDEVVSLRDEIVRLRKSLSELTPPLSVLLRRRGFRIHKQEPPDDLLLPYEPFIDQYYKSLHRYSFRLFLRDVIKHQDKFTLEEVTRYATAGVTAGYIDYLLSVDMIIKTGDFHSLKKRPVKSFGPTLEWFMSEIFEREFAAEAMWGIKFKGSGAGGDFDLLAKVDGSILYMEIKSSPPKQIYANEIAAFLGRISDLHPGIAVFFMDTELRMKDKIVPMFEEELRKTPGAPPAVIRIEKELFRAGNKIFIINAKDSIVNNIEKVLSEYFRNVG